MSFGSELDIYAEPPPPNKQMKNKRKNKQTNQPTTKNPRQKTTTQVRTGENIRPSDGLMTRQAMGQCLVNLLEVCPGVKLKIIYIFSFILLTFDLKD